MRSRTRRTPSAATDTTSNLRSAKGQKLKLKPVDNTRADKLDSFMWRHSFAERRCLIPVTQFAEAEGEKGLKTRTWFSLPDQEVFACAGIWRDAPEWGPAYSMVMTEACIHVADVHDRMPVIIKPANHSTWLDGTADAALALCQPYGGAMTLDRTADLWAMPRGQTP